MKSLQDKMPKLLTHKTIQERFFNKNLLLLDVYINSSVKCATKCLKCFYVWKIKPNDVFNGHGCPNCAKVRKLTKQEINLILKNKNFKLLSKYSNTRKMVLLQCLTCNHLWKNNISKIKFGRGCPKCAIEKRKQTNLKKYGCYVPAQNKEIALKTAKSQNNSHILQHWKTQQKLICVGSYEKKVVEYFNENKIEFLWQPKIFKFKKIKTTYRPDCYLINKGIWIEIKGYFRKDAKEKWELFCSIFPNAELWDRKKLKKLNIL